MEVGATRLIDAIVRPIILFNSDHSSKKVTQLWRGKIM